MTPGNIRDKPAIEVGRGARAAQILPLSSLLGWLLPPHKMPCKESKALYKHPSIYKTCVNIPPSCPIWRLPR